MRRCAIILALLGAVALVLPLLMGCTDLRSDTGLTTTTVAGPATTAPGSPTTLAAAPTSAPPTTGTPTTSAPAPTTTTPGGLHISPDALHTNPSLLHTDPNYIIAPTRYEDTHPFIHWEWETAWKTQTNAECSAGTQKFSNTANTWAGISFQGTGVQLIATKGANGGRLIAHLSGPGVDRQETIDLYSGSPEYQAVVWYSGHLTNADYGVYFEWDDANSGGSVVWIDAIDVWGTVTPP
jgi:hypothetical protein